MMDYFTTMDFDYAVVPDWKEVERNVKQLKKHQLVQLSLTHMRQVRDGYVLYKDLEREYDSLHKYKNTLRDRLRKLSDT